MDLENWRNFNWFSNPNILIFLNLIVYPKQLHHVENLFFTHIICGEVQDFHYGIVKFHALHITEFTEFSRKLTDFYNVVVDHMFKYICIYCVKDL